VCVNMGLKELSLLHEKLDKIIESNYSAHEIMTRDLHKNNVLLAQLEEHQRSINGTIIELKTEVNEHSEKIENNKGSIIFAKGGVYVIGVMGTILSLVALTKSFGLW